MCKNFHSSSSILEDMGNGIGETSKRVTVDGRLVDDFL